MLAVIGRYVRQHHVALLALFVALGGTAYATATIGPQDIKKNAVRSRHIKNGQVGSRDVRDDSLTGADIAESSLRAISPGVVMGRIEDLGNFATVFGSPQGIAPASTSEDAVEMTMPYGLTTPPRAAGLHALLADGLAEPPDTTQTFTVRSGESDTALSCTIQSGNSGCGAVGTVSIDNFQLSIKVQSTGSPIPTADANFAYRFIQ